MSKLVEVDKLTEDQVRALVEGPLSEITGQKCRLEIAHSNFYDRLRAAVYAGDPPDLEGWGPRHETGQTARDAAARSALYGVLPNLAYLRVDAMRVPGPSPSPGGFSNSHRMTVTIDGRHYDATAVEVTLQNAGAKEAEKTDE